MARLYRPFVYAQPNTPPGTSALALGELAINTYDGKLYLKKNVSGTETIVEIGANNLADVFKVYEYPVTTNRTVFSGADGNTNTLSYTTGSPPKVAVFLNGLLLDWGLDFTGTNGTSIVLASAAVSGDLVQIQAYKSEVAISGNLQFDDNVKALFGNDGDLEIYHSGTHSYIKDTGTGNLNILASSSINLLNGDSSDYMARFNDNGSNQFFYDGAQKLATTSTGIQVTGNGVFSGAVTSGSSITIDSSGPYAAGSIYSDGNWGMIFRAKQASPTSGRFFMG